MERLYYALLKLSHRIVLLKFNEILTRGLKWKKPIKSFHEKKKLKEAELSFVAGAKLMRKFWTVRITRYLYQLVENSVNICR